MRFSKLLVSGVAAFAMAAGSVPAVAQSKALSGKALRATSSVKGGKKGLDGTSVTILLIGATAVIVGATALAKENKKSTASP